jgi:hypothetical protein
LFENFVTELGSVVVWGEGVEDNKEDNRSKRHNLGRCSAGEAGERHDSQAPRHDEKTKVLGLVE